MTDTQKPDPGVVVTLKEIYTDVKAIKDSLNSELGRMKVQMGAMWVIHLISVSVYTALITKGM